MMMILMMMEVSNMAHAYSSTLIQKLITQELPMYELIYVEDGG